MKLLFASLLFCFITRGYAQDTLSSFDKNLITTLGGFLISQKNNVIGENELGSTFGAVLKNGTKQVLKGTAQRTITDMLGNTNGGNLLNLPNNLLQHKDVFLQKGKNKMLENFESSLNQAGQQALQDGMQIFIGNAFEKLVDGLINVALSPANANTDSLMQVEAKGIKNDYTNNFLPFAKKAIKVYKIGKQTKKINKFLRKNNLSESQIDAEQVITNGLWEKVNGNILQQLNTTSKNPLNLLKGLIGD